MTVAVVLVPDHEHDKRREEEVPLQVRQADQNLCGDRLDGDERRQQQSHPNVLDMPGGRAQHDKRQQPHHRHGCHGHHRRGGPQGSDRRDTAQDPGEEMPVAGIWLEEGRDGAVAQRHGKEVAAVLRPGGVQGPGDARTQQASQDAERHDREHGPPRQPTLWVLPEHEGEA